MICANSCKNWSCGFGEEVENVKKFTDRWTTKKVYRQMDNRQSEKLTHLSF
jgi:hypothetical protein